MATDERQQQSLLLNSLKQCQDSNATATKESLAN
ncbi:hypothetical protein NHJ13051_008508 [Beauveria bassiana]